MSAEFAIALAILTLGSCYASYCCGQRNILEQQRRMKERMLRFEEFED